MKSKSGNSLWSANLKNGLSGTSNFRRMPVDRSSCLVGRCLTSFLYIGMSDQLSVCQYVRPACQVDGLEIYLAGWLDIWIAGYLTGWLAGWLLYKLPGWLVGWVAR